MYTYIVYYYSLIFQNKKVTYKKVVTSNGSSSWARTSDIMINSHALCQLSYRGISPLAFANFFFKHQR